jgi:hypothetical protein
MVYGLRFRAIRYEGFSGKGLKPWRLASTEFRLWVKRYRVHNLGFGV